MAQFENVGMCVDTNEKLTSNLDSPLAGTAQRGGSTIVTGCSRAWLESEESMVVSSESSDCETVALKSEEKGRSLVTKESESLVERSSFSQIICPLEQPTTAKQEYLEPGSLNLL
jgi:hypothetical protein